jgi:hypothetical protein
MLSRNELPEESDVIAIFVPPASDLALFRALMRFGFTRASVRIAEFLGKKGAPYGAPS